MGQIAERIRKALNPTPEAMGAVATTGQRLLLTVGSFFYVGYLPASGTVSVLLIGVPAYGLLLHRLSPTAYGVFVAVFALASVWVHHQGDRLLGEKDSGKLILDELAGYFVAMSFLPGPTWQLLAAGFVLERGLDILKPFPAGYLEKHAPGGWGVVGDDVVAGAYTCVLLHLAC